MYCVAPSQSQWLCIAKSVTASYVRTSMPLLGFSKPGVAQGVAPDMSTAQWKQVTSDARAASKAALEAFHRHRKEHGCWDQESPETLVSRRQVPTSPSIASPLQEHDLGKGLIASNLISLSG
jgi:hypothetical protein